jgi:hypothetical protein
MGKAVPSRPTVREPAALIPIGDRIGDVQQQQSARDLHLIGYAVHGV